MSEISFDAIVLAGGQGSRLGGVDKAELKVGGVRLLDRALTACRGASTTVVVGPVEAPEGTAARPKLPSSRRTSTSTVGLPRESRI